VRVRVHAREWLSGRSLYPSQRHFKDADGELRGRAGKCELLNSRVFSTQPMVSLDWSREKLGLAVAACLDQTLRVFIVTKLSKL
jgi:WD repeat-containing protein 92